MGESNKYLPSSLHKILCAQRQLCRVKCMVIKEIIARASAILCRQACLHICSHNTHLILKIFKKEPHTFNKGFKVNLQGFYIKCP